jgi:MarR family transcriptional regulator, temperature-dependent positive regulator of motility
MNGADSGSAPLTDNLIGPIWHICFIANSFVFPIYAQFETTHGISRMEFVVMYSLAHRGRLFATDISRITGLPKNNISRGVSKLLGKGLISRSEDTEDGRRAHLEMTAKGSALFEKLAQDYKNRAEQTLSALTAQEVRSLQRLSEKLVQSMDAG